jgi:hypothetical protein
MKFRGGAQKPPFALERNDVRLGRDSRDAGGGFYLEEVLLFKECPDMIED